MKNHAIYISLGVIFSLFSSTIVSAAPYYPTAGLNHVLRFANSLQGKSFKHDPDFLPYCQKYASLAVRQAARRENEGCNYAIPLYNRNIAGRWSFKRNGHYHWCLTVSSHATKGEVLQRENGLKDCLRSYR